MKILVFIKEVLDTGVPITFDGLSQKLRADWNVPVLNPPDRAAVHSALQLKESIPESHITLIHLGPPSGEHWLREGLASGCDEGVRIWDEDLEEIRTLGKAFIFSRMAHILGFDMILTGARSQDKGNGQVGALLASYLNVPFINAALSIKAAEGRIMATKRLRQGYQERVEAPLPLVAAAEARDEPEDAPLPAFLDALEKAIPCRDLSDLGISRAVLHTMDSYLAHGPLQFPKAGLRFAAPPDSSLPAHLRIRKLIEGTVTSREGTLTTGSEDHVVEQLFQTLLKEGWLDHLRKRSP